ncbi:7389_t:CDS:10 [Entrophospora sp. SA101]|nr:7389_t:CDS:10 [Entrophospora sp. SA101]
MSINPCSSSSSSSTSVKFINTTPSTYDPASIDLHYSSGDDDNGNNAVSFKEFENINIPFPPDIKAEALINCKKNGKMPSRSPNSFMVYRKAFVNELHKNGHYVSMTIASPIIAKLWRREPNHIKNAYRAISNQAKRLFLLRQRGKSDNGREGGCNEKDSLPSSKSIINTNNPALLSYIAIKFRKNQKLDVHTKGFIDYSNTFTGSDAVGTIHSLLPKNTPRHVALQMASGIVSDDSKGCYSTTCKNYVHNQNPQPPSINNNDIGRKSIPDFDNTLLPKFSWMNSAPKEILDKISRNELKRQEIIFETIYTEEDYINDLIILETVYVKQLRNATPPIIPPERLEEFIKGIFCNVFDGILTDNKKMLHLLKTRQQQSHVIEKIGDIFLECAQQFGHHYIKYNENFPFADYLVKNEKLKNHNFKEFLERCSRDPQTRRLDFRHFVQRPTPRLQKYVLLLEQILKYTSDDNPDKPVLIKSIEAFKHLCRESDNKVHESEKKVKFRELYLKIRTQDNKVFEQLDILNPERILFFKGELQRRSSNRLEWSDLFVFLFDNYLVLTKRKMIDYDGNEKYIISGKPIPLEMLVLDGFNDLGRTRSGSNSQYLRMFESKKIISKGSRGSKKSNSLSNKFVDNYERPKSLIIDESIQNNQNQQQMKNLSFTIIYVGKNNGEVTYQLYAGSLDKKKLWKEKILEAQTHLASKNAKYKLFELITINDSTFTNLSIGNQDSHRNIDNYHYNNHSHNIYGSSNRKMVAIGTEEGVWIGAIDDAQSYRKVLHIGNVTQMKVLQDFGMFILLVDKSLWAYSLESLITTTPTSSNDYNTFIRHRLSNGHVNYFNAGKIKDKALIVFMKRKGLDSYFKTLEAVYSFDPTNEKYHHRSSISKKGFGFIQSKNEWFKEYKEFNIPSDSYSVNFLKTKLCVTCARGFEIVNLDSLRKIVTIPDFAQHQSLLPIAKLCENSKPLAMFKIGDEYLLCYDALSSPYVIGFNQLFIEIRHIETGNLVQIIPGKNINYLNNMDSNNNNSGNEQDEEEENVIHAVMQHTELDIQYVFQLRKIAK